MRNFCAPFYQVVLCSSWYQQVLQWGHRSCHCPPQGWQEVQVFGAMACRGASCTAKNLDGKTAQEVAQLNSQDEVVAMFEKDAAFL